MKTTNYYNPRIDREEPLGNAKTGRVYLDANKVVWVGSMLLVGTIGTLWACTDALFIEATKAQNGWSTSLST